MKRKIDNVVIECVEGNIVKQDDCDAVVNAANAHLRIGGGVAGAIHRAAGPELERACRPLAPIQPGEAVITPAFNLPNKYVIHCLGPVYGVDQPEDELLRECYQNALKLAESSNLSSIAFPAVSAGAFGFPMEPAARIALKTVINERSNLSTVKLIRFVLFDAAVLGIFTSILDAELKKGP